jgi:hypothetical protein
VRGPLVRNHFVVFGLEGSQDADQADLSDDVLLFVIYQDGPVAVFGRIIPLLGFLQRLDRVGERRILGDGGVFR